MLLSVTTDRTTELCKDDIRLVARRLCFRVHRYIQKEREKSETRRDKITRRIRSYSRKGIKEAEEEERRKKEEVDR